MSVVGIDLAKSVLHVVGMDQRGSVVLRKRLSRATVLPFMAQLLPLLIPYYEKKITLLCNTHPPCQRLKVIPGFEALTVPALAAAVEDVSRFRNGRQLTAWLGIVPRQYSTGGKPRLLGIIAKPSVT